MINDHQDLVDRVQVCGLCITPIPLDLLWHIFISCSPGNRRTRNVHVKRHEHVFVHVKTCKTTVTES